MISKKTKIFLYIILLIVSLFNFYKFITRPKHLETVPSQHNSQEQTQIENNLVASTLNGQMISPETAALRPIAVVIENHPDSRPQSGLSDADIVYEAIAEGGITRFLAIYQSAQPQNLGPIRSARTYFATLADELGAVFAHVGGNSDALANLKAGDYKNLSNADQFFLDNYFHRIRSRPMPHNVYTSMAKLRQLVADKNWQPTLTLENWLYKDDQPQATTTAANIIVDFSTSEFEVKWEYNKQSNYYSRFIKTSPVIDAGSGKPVQAKNVIIQFIKSWPVKTDTIGSTAVDLNGPGKAKIFFDGSEMNATWKKEGNGRTKYYLENGDEVKFNRGQVWVELVPVEKQSQLVWK